MTRGTSQGSQLDLPDGARPFMAGSTPRHLFTQTSSADFAEWDPDMRVSLEAVAKAVEKCKPEFLKCDFFEIKDTLHNNGVPYLQQPALRVCLERLVSNGLKKVLKMVRDSEGQDLSLAEVWANLTEHISEPVHRFLEVSYPRVGGPGREVIERLTYCYTKYSIVVEGLEVNVSDAGDLLTPLERSAHDFLRQEPRRQRRRVQPMFNA